MVIKISKKELDKIIENHQHWLYKDCENYETMRANLSMVDLSGLDLSCVNLKNAILDSAILIRTNLSNANLTCANLRYADLSKADLHMAKIEYADLYNASLNCADLSSSRLVGANLSCADLTEAKLHYANLELANLSCANLSSAYLREAYLVRASLYYANVADANMVDANLNFSNLCHMSGNEFTNLPLGEYRMGKILRDPIIGYKICKGDTMVTLEIPRGAIVFSINGKACRTNKAKVIAIDGADRAFSILNNSSYYIGDEITAYDFNCQYNCDFAKGIYFFMTKEKAKNTPSYIRG